VISTNLQSKVNPQEGHIASYLNLEIQSLFSDYIPRFNCLCYFIRKHLKIYGYQTIPVYICHCCSRMIHS